MDKGAPPARPGPGVMARLFGLASRLLIWYSIITLLFRCPSSQLDLLDSSPRICAPYLAARLRLDPYLEPYYQSYAAPYVKAARPYFDSFYGNIYSPASAFAHSTYSKYAAPRVAQARTYGEHEWERAVKPRIELLKTKADDQYQLLLEPHVKQVNAAISPQLENAKNAALHQYRDRIIPSYQKSLPYLQTAYFHSQRFLVDVAVPYTVWTYDGVVTFVQRRIWPPVRIVYGRNVEPQLSKIRERLSSYRDGKVLEAAAADEIDNNPSITLEAEPSASSSAEPIPTPEPSSGQDEQLSTDSTADASPSPDADPQTQNQEEGKLTNELRRWQTKFAKASDKGGEDLANRVADITTRQIDAQAEGLGTALITQLDEAANQALSNLKSIILDSVQALPEDSADQDKDAAFTSILTALRAAGTSIKDRAQEIRVWKIKYQQETESLVQAASDSTLDVIDNIRDLGLQQIGLRWAGMDDVTYQDWAEYHKLKKTFDDWRVQVQGIATSHEGLTKARQAGEDIEDRGMEIAQNAAVELARLKDVAKWKIHAHDTSDDFSSRQLPAAAARIGQIIKQKFSAVKESVQSVTSTQGTVESVMSVASEGAASAASSISSVVLEPSAEETMTAPGTKEDTGDDAAAQRLIDDEGLADSVLDAIHKEASDTSEAPSKPSTTPEDIVSGDDSSTPLAASIFSAATEKVSAMSAKILDRNEDETSELLEEVKSPVSASIESLTEEFSSIPIPGASFILADPSASAASLSEEAAQVLDDATGTAKSVTASIASSTSDMASEVSRASSEAVSVAAEYESSAESAYGRATATVANSAIIMGEDAVDKGRSISEIIQSKVSEAGKEYSTVTQTLHRPASETSESVIAL